MFVIGNDVSLYELGKGFFYGGLCGVIAGYFVVKNVDTIDYYYDKYFSKKSN